MLPAAAVPVKTSVASVVRPSPAGALSPLKPVMTGAAGGWAAMVKPIVAAEALTFPAASLARAVMVWAPSVRIGRAAVQAPV